MSDQSTASQEKELIGRALKNKLETPCLLIQKKMPRETVKYVHIFYTISQFSKVQAADAQRKKPFRSPPEDQASVLVTLFPLQTHTQTKTHVNSGVQQAN